MHSKIFIQKKKDTCAKNESFCLTAAELNTLPAGTDISVEATTHSFRIAISVPEENVRYVVDNLSKFTCEPITVQE